jgi:hypothetical protein
MRASSSFCRRVWPPKADNPPHLDSKGNPINGSGARVPLGKLLNYDHRPKALGSKMEAPYQHALWELQANENIL